ncbi:hypothetical protein JM946_03675 [Steroidobacter sp. S1-65]|uniref:Uncharacterized protein n=1 Tax=Steroidobacter gossypii TaxID=2805490 RepID=A0ABS1WS69_9GAMM|nr:hypothetical protein [Steroidobacter gossypii]MBM0103824.1 hypothetical protein [Steroidobacter gossypii]
MIKAKIVTGAILLASSLGALADTYNFDSISKVSYNTGLGMQLTGVLVDDTAPTTIVSQNSHVSTRCDSMVAEMLKNPGAYTLSVTLNLTAPQRACRWSTT